MINDVFSKLTCYPPSTEQWIIINKIHEQRKDLQLCKKGYDNCITIGLKTNSEHFNKRGNICINCEKEIRKNRSIYYKERYKRKKLEHITEKNI